MFFKYILRKKENNLLYFHHVINSEKIYLLFDDSKCHVCQFKNSYFFVLSYIQNKDFASLHNHALIYNLPVVAVGEKITGAVVFRMQIIVISSDGAKSAFLSINVDLSISLPYPLPT